MEGMSVAAGEAAAKRLDAGRPEKRRRWTPVTALQFVGCESCRMTLAEYEAYPEDAKKIEFFDSGAALAWMVREPPSAEHEEPARTLGQLVARIAMVRGSSIKCLGATQLRLLDSKSSQVRSMHPDELLFLDPGRAAGPGFGYRKVGEQRYPDVVLEVDHTTDVRRNKLDLYEEWGFPELWVEVPDAYVRSRPRGLRPGLRIYLLEAGRYGLSAESRAFPGWQAREIHRALNESMISAETAAVLARVGRALGEREGTGPDDDPLLGPHRAEARIEGRVEARLGLVRGGLASRGISVSADVLPPRNQAALAAASDTATLSAALSASGEADFFARLRSDRPTAKR